MKKAVDLPPTDDVRCHFNATAGVLELEYQVLLGLEPAWLKLHLTHKAATKLLQQLEQMRAEILSAQPTKAGLN